LMLEHLQSCHRATAAIRLEFQPISKSSVIRNHPHISKLKNANSRIETPNPQPTTNNQPTSTNNQHQPTSTFSAGNPLLGSSRYPGMPPAEMRPPYCGSRASIR
jgi:hypothetical protein